MKLVDILENKEDQQNQKPSVFSQWEDTDPKNDKPSAVEESKNNPQQLYHATLIDNVPSILQSGLTPRVGKFTAGIYKDRAKPRVFASDLQGARRVYNALVSQIWYKLGHTPNAEEVAQHGALLIISKDVDKFQQYPADAKRRRGSLEPGDYYSEEPIRVDQVIKGNDLVKWIKQHQFDQKAGFPLVELDTDTVEEKWTKKYKKSINCSNPQGFSQRAHCAARRKRQKGGQTTSKSVSETGSPNQSQVTEIEITPEQQFGQDHILQRLHLATQQKNLIDGFEIYLYDENHTRLIAAWDDKNKQLAAAVVFQHMPKLRSRLYVAKNTEVFPQYQGQRLSGKLYKYCCEVLDMTIQSDMWQSASAKSLWTKTLPALGLHPQILDTTTNRTFSPDKIDPYKNNNHRYCWILEAHDNYPNHISEQSLIQPYRGIYASASQLLGITPSKGPESRMDALVETLLTQLTSQGLTESQAVAHINGRLDEDLRKWFQQKWVRFGPDGKIRGACARGKDSEGKPKCLPQSKAHALGKKGRATAARRKRREDPNAEREGKARNVATKSRSNESFDRDEFLRHMAKLRAREELRKTDPVKALVQDLKDQDKQPPAKKPSDDSDLGDPNIDPLNERLKKCPHCGGPVVSEQELEEKQDACYYKVKSRYKVWPSAYASGALVQCRKRGAKNWGKGKKK